MAWCEANKVDYVFGLARNARLEERIADDLDEARLQSMANAGQPARAFRDFEWSTRDSWSRRRRVVGKAEWARGEAESALSRHLPQTRRLAGQTALRKTLLRPWRDGEPDQGMSGHLFADRTSTATMRANQSGYGSLRWPTFSSAPCAASGSPIRRWPTRPAGTIRLKLLKLGALVKVSARRVKIAFASACPSADEWRLAAARFALARGSPA